MGAEFKHIALVDTENKKFQLWGTEVGGIEKRISLLEENSKVFSSILNRKIEIKYDMEKDDLICQGFSEDVWLYDHLQTEYDKSPTLSKPILKRWA